MAQTPRLLKPAESIDWVKVGVFPFTGEPFEQHAIRKHYYRSMTSQGMQYFMLVGIENPFNNSDLQAEN